MIRKFSFIVLSTFILSIIFFLNSGVAKGATDHLVINEVQIAGATTDDEFIELYNPTGQDISISGWKLKKMTSTGTETNLVASLPNTIIPSHRFFLVTPPTGFDGGITPDATYSNTTNRIAGNNTVLLYDGSSVLIDKVGFGTAGNYEGAPYPSSPPANGSIERVLGGDTDNNSLDFQTKEVSDPENSSFIEVTPTPIPTEVPTPTPTETPTTTPTASPTETPTPTPTISPTVSPTPTVEPTATPTVEPTATPTAIPTETPTIAPTSTPTSTPTIAPTSTPNNNPPGWLKSPVFTCTNPHVPAWVYALLKFLMPQKFSC